MNQLHMIGNAHIDPVWLWRWQEGFAEIKATFRSALDRIRDNREFVFTCACACYYEWIEENEPEMFEEIRNAVRLGQWVIVGGMWIQPDMNTPSGESIARQLLYSQRYFMSRFGRRVVTGYNVDSFGHNAMLPQLLKKAGITSYVWMRPGVHENPDIPQGAMLWEAPDGSRVKAYRIYNEYTCASDVTGKMNRHETFADGLGIPVMVFYGVGNHGGGPTVELLKEIDAYRAEYPGRAVYSDPDRYFAELDEAKLPVWRNELQHHASGCYSTSSDTKYLHRRAENALLSLERFDVLSRSLTGMSAEKKSVDGAWKGLLFNEFHDIMGGCSLKESLDDVVTQLREVLSVCAREENRLLQRIAWRIDTMNGVKKVTDGMYRYIDGSDKGMPLHVFNPHPFDAEQTIRLTNQYAGAAYPNGAKVPVQLVRGTRTNGISRFDTLLTVKVPAMGYTTVYVKNDTEGHPAQPLYDNTQVIENRYLRAEFDALTGELIRLCDKTAGRDCLKAKPRFDVIDITSADTWAHNIFRFDRKCGEFSPVSWTIADDGEVRRTLRVKYAHGASTIEVNYMLYRDSKQLDIELFADIREEHKLIRFAVPTPYETEIAEIAYGALKRTACGNEEHCQRWIAMEGDGAGLALINDGKYSYCAENGVLAQTISNTSLYADHYGQAYRDDTCRFMDHGEQVIRLALRPYSGTWSENALHRAAALLNDPFRAVMGTYHEGRLPETMCGIRTDNSAVEVGAVKPAEDGKGVVVRLSARSDRAQKAGISLPLFNRTLKEELAPFEIRTLYVPFAGDEAVRETDLTETD